MKPPEDATVYETQTSCYWFEGDLLYIIGKKGPQPDMETTIRETEEFKKRLGGRMVCAIMDVSQATASTKEAREYSSKQLTHFFKAIAFVIKNPVSRMVAHLYMAVMPLPLPMKMFSSEEEAYAWVTKFK